MLGIIAVSPAHPRACGENFPCPWIVSSLAGSSPRMRGKRSSLRSNLMEDGLIPAHAGKTRGEGEKGARERAHPRACGENDGDSVCLQFGVGSSPRMRGKPRPSARTGTGGGLIPAHAGKTEIYEDEAATAAAHPRACGENAAVWKIGTRTVGSSPRMRGKLDAPLITIRSGRLIPAHAGKTC